MTHEPIGRALVYTGRIDARVASPESMALAYLQGEVDFSFAFAVVP